VTRALPVFFGAAIPHPSPSNRKRLLKRNPSPQVGREPVGCGDEGTAPSSSPGKHASVRFVPHRTLRRYGIYSACPVKASFSAS